MIWKEEENVCSSFYSQVFTGFKGGFPQWFWDGTLSTWCLFSTDCMRFSKGMRGDNSSGSNSDRAHMEHNMAKRYRGILIWTQNGGCLRNSSTCLTFWDWNEIDFLAVQPFALFYHMPGLHHLSKISFSSADT